MSRIRRLVNEGAAPDYDAYNPSIHNIADTQIFGGTVPGSGYHEYEAMSSFAHVFEAPEDCFVFPFGYSDDGYAVAIYVGDSSTSTNLYRVSNLDGSYGAQSHSSFFFLRKGQVCSVVCNTAQTLNHSFWLPVKK